MVFLLSVLILGLGLVGQAEAASTNPLDAGCRIIADKGPVCNDAKAQATNNNNPAIDVISKGASVIAAIAGVGAVIMIITGGMNYATSSGNAENAKSAKNRIVSAVVGLVIIVLAWVIIRFVTDKILS